jgi:hypothetical protein
MKSSRLSSLPRSQGLCQVRSELYWKYVTMQLRDISASSVGSSRIDTTRTVPELGPGQPWPGPCPYHVESLLGADWEELAMASVLRWTM